MELKPSEIIAIVLAVLIPAVVFALAIIPGGFQSIFDFALKKQTAPYVFGGAALVVTGILGFRIYRRIRPAPKRKGNAGDSFFDLWRGPK